MIGTAYDDIILSTLSGNEVFAGDGDDFISYGNPGGTFFVNGGAGIDSVKIPQMTSLKEMQNSSEYSFIKGSDLANPTIDISTFGFQGQIKLQDVEYLEFNNGIKLSLDEAEIFFNRPSETSYGYIYSWNNRAMLDGVSVSLVDKYTSSSTSDVTDFSGGYFLDTKHNLSNNIFINKSIELDEYRNAVDMDDVLLTLSIASGHVGLNSNLSPLDEGFLYPYQIIAADVDKSGSVNAFDALSIMKTSAGITNAIEPTWEFVSEDFEFLNWNDANTGKLLTVQLVTTSTTSYDTNLSNVTNDGVTVLLANANYGGVIEYGAVMNLDGEVVEVGPDLVIEKDHVDWGSITSSVDFFEDDENIIGVLMGDVDGSWVAADSARYNDSVLFANKYNLSIGNLNDIVPVVDFVGTELNTFMAVDLNDPQLLESFVANAFNFSTGVSGFTLDVATQFNSGFTLDFASQFSYV